MRGIFPLVVFVSIGTILYTACFLEQTWTFLAPFLSSNPSILEDLLLHNMPDKGGMRNQDSQHFVWLSFLDSGKGIDSNIRFAIVTNLFREYDKGDI
eukprot:gene32285-43121_t